VFATPGVGNFRNGFDTVVYVCKLGGNDNGVNKEI
jgi:hypothetical protein